MRDTRLEQAEREWTRTSIPDTFRLRLYRHPKMERDIAIESPRRHCYKHTRGPNKTIAILVMITNICPTWQRMSSVSRPNCRERLRIASCLPSPKMTEISRGASNNARAPNPSRDHERASMA